MIRVATIEDLPLIVELIAQHGYIMGQQVSPEMIENYIFRFRRYLENPEASEFMLSIGEDGNINCGFRQNLLTTFSKTYIFTDLITRPGSLYFTPKNTGFDEITEYFVKKAESRGFYSYSLIMQAGKNWKKRNNYNVKNQIEILQRYDYYDEIYIPAGVLPTEIKYRNMMGERAWTIDLVIMTRALKNEFRNPLLLVAQ